MDEDQSERRETPVEASVPGQPEKKPESILVVDDDPIISRLLEIELEAAGFVVALAKTGEDAIKFAQQERPDLLLLDVVMPGMDGFEVARRLRSDPRTLPVSIIMLTATGLSANRLEGLNAGADDYIVKPFDTPELMARVKGVLRRAKEMRAQSPLTGLPGYIRIEEEIDRRIAEERGFAVLYADLDYFKAFNDHYGFERGDDVLRYTGRLIKEIAVEVAGDSSFIGHVGGDDFVVVTSPELATDVADAVIESFDAKAPSFYTDEDRQKGYIEVENRRGDLQRYPIVSISLGIASTERRKFTHYAEVVAVAAEMKEFTKRTPGSVWAVDRRTN
ncbi:MAG: response regulator [Actinobacteria bacterium]|nr:response regulator [Actinomycetota bacterium]